MIKQTREEYRRAFYAWSVACRIRRAHRGVGPVKKWYDECRVMLARAERAHRRALWQREGAYRQLFAVWGEIRKHERTPPGLIQQWQQRQAEVRQWT